MDEYADGQYDAFSGTSNGIQLIECNNCGRNFNENAIQRHIPICQKQAAKKRKVFDSSKQRAEGTEIKLQKGRPKPGHAPKPVPAKKSNWRQTHSDFINTIRAAKGYQQAVDQGLPPPPPPPPTINPDYIQCPHCTRRFNAQAAERHMKFCEEQSSRLPNKKKVDPTAQARAAARTQYKAPKLKPKDDYGGTASGYGYGGGSTSGYGSTRASPGQRSTFSSTRRRLISQGASSASSTSARRTSQPKSAGKPSPGNSRNMNNSSGSTDHNAGLSGRSLRTGRTQENYDEGRSLSAKQRMQHGTRGGAGNKQQAPYSSSRYAEDPRGFGGSGGGAGSGGYGRRQADHGYHSGDSDYNGGAGGVGGGGGAARSNSAAKFCHECGSKYPVSSAKFCCECGIRRM